MGTETKNLEQENKELRAELERQKALTNAAAADIEELIWLYGPCRFCIHGKTGTNRFFDRPCMVCEPKWRGLKRK